MYAVIQTGGKQYNVSPGKIIQVEKLDGEKGTSLRFDQVLMVNGDSLALGKPYLQGAFVEAEVVSQGRGDKILIIKMKRRKQYRRTQGHRQDYTQLLVTSVDSGAGQKSSLSAEDKKATLDKFVSYLKPKGEPRTAPTPVREKRHARAHMARKKATARK